MGKPAVRRSIKASEPRGGKRRASIDLSGKKEKTKGARMLYHDIVGGTAILGGVYLLTSLFLVELNPLSGAKNFLGEIGFGVAHQIQQFFGAAGYFLAASIVLMGIRMWRHVDESLPRWPQFASLLLGAALFAGILGFFGAGGVVGNGLLQGLIPHIGVAGVGLLFSVLFILALSHAFKASPKALAKAGVIKASGAGVSLVRGSASFTGWFTKELVGALRLFFRLPSKRGQEKVWEKDLDLTEEMPKPRRRKGESLSQNIEKEEVVSLDAYDPPATHIVVKRPSPVQPEKSHSKLHSLRSGSAAPRGEYKLPPLSLLTAGEDTVVSESEAELLEISRVIEGKLRDFSILGRVTEVHPGPVVTMFEFEPAPGVKVGRISALQDDLAMSLKAVSLRIVAPIPKKGTVGIEVPNKTRDIVRLRTVLESDAMRSSPSILTVGIGKDAYGDPVCADIAAMPHLLIAGTTGTGKSVCINTVLLSLLYRATPKELGLILIDPKILELSVYEGIPHLRVPVVTVPKQARAVLDWAAKEMDRRYRLMQRFGVRNIDGYNKVVEGGDDKIPVQDIASLEGTVSLGEEEIIAEGTVVPTPPKEEPLSLGRDGLFQQKLEPLPKIVIVIDELADLMLTVGRDIEELITRLAQKARAAGIHLIVATQRPSVDVITGLIKANFPARLSFRVASRIDSRTILDAMGAEKLLGKGDMLFLQPGGSSARRVHCAFVSDAEVKNVIEVIKQNGPPSYDDRIMTICEKALEEDAQGSNGSDGGDASEYDAVYDKAVELVIQKGQASTSMLQRAFRIGYNRAARIVELMEKEGVVGPMDGVKPREVMPGASQRRAEIQEASKLDDPNF